MVFYIQEYIIFLFPGEVGFLAEDRRINVAVTRARRHIAIVCDTHTVQSHPFLKSLIDHVTQHGEVRTAFEYLRDIVPQNYTHDHKEGKTDTPATRQKVKGQPPSKATQGKKMAAASCASINAANETHQKPPTTMPTKEEQNKSRYSEIKKQVELFLEDKERTELQFPPSFNSHERLLIHQVAEELGLMHESKGEGKYRHITVSRPVKAAPAEQLTPEGKEQVQPNPSESTQELLLQLPVDLKGLHLERMEREQQKREEKAQQRRQQNSAPPASSSKKNKSAKGL